MGDGETHISHPPASTALPEVTAVDLDVAVEARSLSGLERPLQVRVRDHKLLPDSPWVRSLGKMSLEVSTQGWRFPTPCEPLPAMKPRLFRPDDDMLATPLTPAPLPQGEREIGHLPSPVAAERLGVRGKPTRLRLPGDTVIFKERLLYMLQPPLENFFAGKQVELPFKPYPYQIEGIAFLMPRHAALLADEMGLGKTMQTIIALRLLFHAGLIRRVLLVCPKPLVNNWSHELRMWGSDLPFEVIGGDADQRRVGWTVSNCPLKLVNYESLTRDAAFVADEKVSFDVVVLDEAQRIKNREAKTAQVVRAIRRERSWALTGTPIENKPDDLVSIFAFVDEERIPPETPAKRLPQLTSDCILRRTKDDVLTDLPPKTIRDCYLELTPPQREAYELAEKEGVVRLNELGDTISVQHVFELVMRLKQICNFDPMTRQSAKLEQLTADLAEVADSGRKAIVFSQWVEPLVYLAEALQSFGPLQFHGKISPRERPAVLDTFQNRSDKHVLLMSYGTGSVGLNLQCASYVFLFDRWWNPAVEDQAINRAHRIGQKQPVFVSRFITPGTIEGRIAEVLERKRQLFNELIEQNGPPPQLGLSEAEIFGLFNIQARPRRLAA